MLLSLFEVETALLDLRGWKLDPARPALARHILFKSFTQALAYMCEMVAVSEQLIHFPKWANTGPMLDIALTTYEACGVTQRDVDWAESAEVVLARYPLPPFKHGPAAAWEE